MLAAATVDQMPHSLWLNSGYSEGTRVAQEM